MAKPYGIECDGQVRKQLGEGVMGVGYPVEALANSVLHVAEGRGIRIDPMKLQKLMYLCHGYYLAITSKPLIDEDFEAWPYGPVVPTIYHNFKECGSDYIKKGERANQLIFVDDDVDNMEVSTPYIMGSDKIFSAVSDFVFDKYGSKSGIYLSELTHKVGSPWHETREESKGKRNAAISNDLIKKYFSKLV